MLDQPLQDLSLTPDLCLAFICREASAFLAPLLRSLPTQWLSPALPVRVVCTSGAQLVGNSLELRSPRTVEFQRREIPVRSRRPRVNRIACRTGHGINHAAGAEPKMGSHVP